MRLNRYVSLHGKVSRREADELIKAGRINVEKTKATFQTVLQEGQRVFIDGKFLKPKSGDFYTVIVYHKPKGELVSKKDDRGRRVVYDSLGEKYASFVPVGRLDFASEGLLILTDSKKVAQTLMESSLEREYVIKINGSVTAEMIAAMEKGIELTDAKAGAHPKTTVEEMTFAPFVKSEITKNTRNFSRLKVAITEGKNRELRRFFAHFGREVLDLRRVRYGHVRLNALPVGKTRFLTKEEYRLLHEWMAKTSLPQAFSKQP